MRLIEAFLTVINIEKLIAYVPSAQVNMPSITLPSGQKTAGGSTCTTSGIQFANGATSNLPIADGGSVVFTCPGGSMLDIFGKTDDCAGLNPAQPCNPTCTGGSVVITDDDGSQDIATCIDCLSGTNTQICNIGG